MSGRALLDVMERLVHLAAAQEKRFCGSMGLQPVQLRALRYLARANRHSDTPIAAAEYLSLTKGTVSQTLRVLRRKGLLREVTAPVDRRNVHLTLTPKAKRLLAGISAAPWSGAGRGLEPALEDLLRQLAKSRGWRDFGLCRSCGNHVVEDGGRHHCARTREGVSVKQSRKICRHHRPGD